MTMCSFHPFQRKYIIVQKVPAKINSIEGENDCKMFKCSVFKPFIIPSFSEAVTQCHDIFYQKANYIQNFQMLKSVMQFNDHQYSTYGVESENTTIHHKILEYRYERNQILASGKSTYLFTSDSNVIIVELANIVIEISTSDLWVISDVLTNVQRMGIYFYV